MLSTLNCLQGTDILLNRNLVTFWNNQGLGMIATKHSEALDWSLLTYTVISPTPTSLVQHGNSIRMGVPSPISSALSALIASARSFLKERMQSPLLVRARFSHPSSLIAHEMSGSYAFDRMP
jgi:hypothetical protein